MKHLFIYILLLMLFIGGCQNPATPEPEQKPVSATEEQLITFNQAMVAEENDHIDALVQRYKWDVITTERGARYRVYETGNGEKIVAGNILQCEYTLKLITGEEIYNSKTDGNLLFKVGKSDQPSGLEEVLLLLRQGDRANIIVPSYLAHGLAGDDNKIPSAATLIYDIYIEKVDEN